MLRPFFIILRAQLLEEMGRYAEAADFMKNVLDQLRGQGVAQGLDAMGVAHEQVRTDEYTGKRFLFFEDPDGLPIEVYEK